MEIGKAEIAGRALAETIKAMTDLFYQVDTRDRFIGALLLRLAELKVEMDEDRQARRQGGK